MDIWQSVKRRHLAPGPMISSPLAQSMHKAPVYSDDLAFSEEHHCSPEKPRSDAQQQLLTPQPSSSSAGLFSSSPRRAPSRIFPAKQTASPDVSGAWLSIGRSSKDSEIALPPSNRLISRRHAEVRFLRDQDALEVRCLGFNGLGVRIGGQALFVKRSCSILLQLGRPGGAYQHQAARNVVLDLAGSTVVICPPATSTKTSLRMQNEEDDITLPMPSSPALDVIEEEDEELLEQAGADALISPLDLNILSAAASSPPSAGLNGVLTPTQSPARKKQRLQSEMSEDQNEEMEEEPEASALIVEGLEHERQSDRQGVLQPRRLQFAQSDNRRRPPTPPKKSADRGKENTPPAQCSQSYPSSPQQLVVHSPVPAVQVVTSRSTLPSPAIARLEQAAESPEVPESQQVARPSQAAELPQAVFVAVNREEELHEAYMSATNASAQPKQQPDVVAETSVVDARTKATFEQPEKAITESSEESQEDGADPEFVDMILTTLASSTLSPTPISYFTPFFPEETTVDQIEAFLRSQACVAEVERTGKDASGNLLRSEWYYEPRADTDVLRRQRLESLRKPIRGTRKVHHQYFWQPVALRKPLASSGLIEPKTRKKSKAKKTDASSKRA